MFVLATSVYLRLGALSSKLQRKQLLSNCHRPLSSANDCARLSVLLQIPRPEVDPEAYQKALARTRQAQCVQRAIGYMRANEPSRCGAYRDSLEGLLSCSSSSSQQPATAHPGCAAT
jgi:hypothetical protein